MCWLRVTILAQMVAIIYLAFGFAARSQVNAWWVSATFPRAIATIAVATLVMLHRRGQARAFWSGFAAFGWRYLALVFGPWFANQPRPLLLTYKLIDRLHFALATSSQSGHVRIWDGTNGRPIDRSPQKKRSYTITFNANVRTIRDVDAANGSAIPWGVAAEAGPADSDVYVIGHSLFALLVGLLRRTAGLIASAPKRGPVKPAKVRPSATGP